ncbi:MAG: hypothetical protein RIG62_06335 [Cyclobacteriaceae bacterium]
MGRNGPDRGSLVALPGGRRLTDAPTTDALPRGRRSPSLVPTASGVGGKAPTLPEAGYRRRRRRTTDGGRRPGSGHKKSRKRRSSGLKSTMYLPGKQGKRSCVGLIDGRTDGRASGYHVKGLFQRANP